MTGGRQTLLVFAWAAVAAWCVLLPLNHVTTACLDYDEGPQLQAAWLESMGCPLYSKTVLNKPPLFSWWLETAFALGGRSIASARTAVLGLNILGLAAFAGLAARWFGGFSGPLAVALLALLPGIQQRLLVVQNDLGALSCALVALLAADLSRQRGEMIWAAAAGFMLAAAVLIHPIVIFHAPLVLWLLLAGPSRGRGDRLVDRLPMLLPAAGAGLALLVVVCSLVDVAAMVRWVVSYNLGPAGHTGVGFRLATMSRWWREGLPALPVAAAALGLPMAGSSAGMGRWATFCGTWLALVVATLLSRDPLWEHYVLLTAFPLVLWLTGSLAWLWGGMAGRTALFRSLAVCVLLLLVAQRSGRSHPWPAWTPEHLAVLGQLRELRSTSGRRFVVTDNQFLAFAASCPVPPALADTSHKRISSGLLSEADVIRELAGSRTLGVLFDTGRLSRLAMLEPAVRLLGTDPWKRGETRWYPLPERAVAPERRVEYSFGETLRLAGYSWIGARGAVHPRFLLLFWNPSRKPETDFLIRVTLLDSKGTVIWRRAGRPFLGLCPTSEWRTGDLVVDPRPIPETDEGAFVGVSVLPGPGRSPLPVFGARGYGVRIPVPSARLAPGSRGQARGPGE